MTVPVEVSLLPEPELNTDHALDAHQPDFERHTALHLPDSVCINGKTGQNF